MVWLHCGVKYVLGMLDRISAVIRAQKYHKAFIAGFIVLTFGVAGSFFINEERVGRKLSFFERVLESYKSVLIAGVLGIQDVLVSSETIVQSVDNTYLLSVDLGSFNSGLTVTSVKEDGTYFFVDYTHQTIMVRDYAWRKVEERDTLAVSKAALRGEDLGVFVARELGQVVDQRLAYLKEAQSVERDRGQTLKVVTTDYSGLIGKFLDSEETIFEGYTPVKEPVIVEGDEAPSYGELGVSAVGQEVVVVNENVESASVSVSASGDREPPVIIMLGNNPATIQAGSTYSDLGVTISDNVNDNLGYRVAVNGRDVFEVSIDTSAAGEHVITYTATDQAGNTSTATRRIIVSGGPRPAPSSVANPNSNSRHSGNATSTVSSE